MKKSFFPPLVEDKPSVVEDKWCFFVSCNIKNWIPAFAGMTKFVFFVFLIGFVLTWCLGSSVPKDKMLNFQEWTVNQSGFSFESFEQKIKKTDKSSLSDLKWENILLIGCSVSSVDCVQYIPVFEQEIYKKYQKRLFLFYWKIIDLFLIQQFHNQINQILMFLLFFNLDVIYNLLGFCLIWIKQLL